INKILAQAAEQEKIILGVGSQRAGIDKDNLIGSFKVVRQYAPSVPIIGNIGIGQISDKDFKLDDFSKCIEMINADVMAIHFNALHELVQKDGDVTYDNFSKNFQKIRNNFEIPIIAKEVGCGFNYETAKKLDEMGFDGFDIGGAGGTSFSKIEFYRSNEENRLKRSLSKLFGEWGIPTPISIKLVRKATNKPIIATGGLRNGMDILKSLFLGADFGGFASKFLNSAWKDLKNSDISNTTYEIQQLKNELKSSMWLTNTKDLNLLKKNTKRYILMGKIKEWLIDSDQTF
ncbi:MAG: alpha-hydroxy-acid oxidizing protein, partial [Candidatus Lokiarchaeota archaeon]